MNPVSDSLESIEKDYVLVNAHLASVECISYFAETSQRLDCKTGASTDTSEKHNEQARKVIQEKELADSSVGGVESAQKLGADLLPTSSASTILRELQGLSILHPSTRIRLLHQYIQLLVELSQEKVCCCALLKSEYFPVLFSVL